MGRFERTCSSEVEEDAGVNEPQKWSGLTAGHWARPV
jgi:hypothetical protein